MTTIKLFRVTTIVNEYDGYKNVVFGWFHNDGHNGPPRPYAELIQGYDQLSDDDRYWPEQYVDELFTEEEATQLKAHIDEHYSDSSTTIIQPAKLPVKANVMPTGAIPVGGEQDFHTGLGKGQLPFKPWAYYDLRGEGSMPGCGGRIAG